MSSSEDALCLTVSIPLPFSTLSPCMQNTVLSSSISLILDCHASDLNPRIAIVVSNMIKGCLMQEAQYHIATNLLHSEPLPQGMQSTKFEFNIKYTLGFIFNEYFLYRFRLFFSFLF